MELKELYIGELLRHPWQANIPDMPPQEWKAFKQDVKRRGIRDPLRVSRRDGQFYIVDGHQRYQVAVDLNIGKLPVIIESFATYDDEITYLAGAARHRRNLTDAQKVAIARAYEEHFRPAAVEAQQASGGDRTSAEAKKAVTVNLAQPLPRQPTSAKKAAEIVGLSETQYRRSKVIQDKASEETKAAWRKGEVSTNAAYEETRKNAPPQSPTPSSAPKPEPTTNLSDERTQRVTQAKAELFEWRQRYTDLTEDELHLVFQEALKREEG